MTEYSHLGLDMIGTANVAIEALARGLGVASVSVASGNVTLTEDESRHGVVLLTGAPGASRTVTVDADVSRAILFRNDTTGGQVVSVLQSGGTAYPVPAGQSLLLLSTGAASLLGPPGVSVTQHGAKGDGTTDDTAAFNAAVTALGSVGGMVFVPPGTYRIAGTISLTPRVELCGAGMYATTLLADDVAGQVVEANVNHSVFRALAATNTLGSYTVTLVTGGGADFSAGATIYLQDNNADNGTFTTRVRSVAGDVVTMQEAAPFTWDHTNGGQAFGYSGANAIFRGIAVRDMTIRNTASTPANRGNMVRFSRVEDSIIERVRAQASASGPPIIVLSCRNVIVRDCHAEDAPALNEGIGFQTSTACAFENNTTHNCPFGIVGTRSVYCTVSRNQLGGLHSTNQGRGLKLDSGCAHCQVNDNCINGFAFFGIYIEDGWQNLVRGNTIFGNGNSVTSPETQHGIQIGGNAANLCRYNSVIGNNVHGSSGYGITINPTAGHLSEQFNLIEGNVVSHCNHGILSASCKNAIVGNMIHDIEGGYISASGGGIGVHCVGQSGAGATGNTIVGNTFGPGMSQAAILTSGANSNGGNVIWGNNLGGNAVSLHATDATIRAHLTATATWDPGSLASGAQTSTTVTVTGAALGDTVTVGFSLDLQALQLTGYVSAANTVTVLLRNGTAGTVDLASGTLRVNVWQN